MGNEGDLPPSAGELAYVAAIEALLDHLAFLAPDKDSSLGRLRMGLEECLQDWRRSCFPEEKP